MNESLRDRRTILTLVLMPLLLYPVLAAAFQQFLLSSLAEKAGPVYRLGFQSRADADALMSYLDRRPKAPATPNPHPTQAADESAAQGQHSQPVFQRFWSEDLQADVQRGAIDVGIRPRLSGGPKPRRGPGPAGGYELLYRQDSAVGLDCVRRLEYLCAQANVRLLEGQLQLFDIPGRYDPVSMHAVALPDPNPRGSSLLPALVPLILILMTITGAVYPAIDLTAGERERGTLEVLVAAPIPRLSVLFAKYLAVLTVATLTALVNLGMMTLTLRVSGIGRAVFGSAVSPLALLEVLGLLLLFAAFFSAVLLAVTSFARSFKEAQAYLIPLMLLALAPGVLGLMPGLSLEGPLAVVPLLNIVLLARDLLAGTAHPAAAGVVVLTTLLYALAAVTLAARIFGAEAVLSSEQSGWSDMWSRPSEPRPTAGAASALLCLALLFPACFLANSGLAQLPHLSLDDRLELTALANLVLFGAFPLAWIWHGRIRLASGLRWAWPGWQPCAAGLLLGLSLWPFAHELILFLRHVGFTTLRPAYLERVQEALGQWRALSPAFLVLVLAILPAVLEELFFRGFLFSALLSVCRPSSSILASAALFALFHLLVTDALAIERLPPSLLLGVVLGWVCWRTGSVLPGMLLHASYNGVLILLAYYEPFLVEQGWVPSGEGHLPAGLLLGAALGSVLGAAWLWHLGREGIEKSPTEGQMPQRR